jgi:cytidylate kinase
MKRITVAIDGPAGSGKSTVARLVAKRLGYLYIDTGAMYRTVTLAVLNRGVDIQDRELVAEVARTAAIEMQAAPEGLRVLLDGEDVGQSIRTPEISALTSQHTANSPGVRAAMVERQRQMGAAGGVVMEGRDISTVVFPQAELKVFLDCSVDERVRRRALEFTQKGIAFDALALKQAVQNRDYEDRNRPIGALKRAEGAIEVLSDGKSIEHVVDEIIQHLPKAE